MARKWSTGALVATGLGVGALAWLVGLVQGARIIARACEEQYGPLQPPNEPLGRILPPPR